MFKLIKIQNSGSNVPEPITLPAGAINAPIGSAVTLDGGIIINCTATTAPTHVLLRELKASDGKAICYRVTPDMLFETEVSGVPTALKVGAKVKLHLNSNSNAICVSQDTASGVAKIVSLDGASAAGDKITVAFN